MKNTPAQLELFDLHNQDAHSNALKADPIQLAKARDYQKLIFRVIAFIFFGLVSFSLGVEKGKKSIAMVSPQETRAPFVPLDKFIDTQRSRSINAPAAGESASAIGINNVQVDKKVDGAYIEKAKTEGKSKEAQYTVQVASILRSENVKKELSRLENKGFSAFGLLKGKYTVVCVGKFTAREQAQNALAKLKTKYPDCQIRKL